MGDGYYMRTKNDQVGEAGRKRVSLYGTVTMDDPYGNFRRASAYKPLPEPESGAGKEAQWKASRSVYDPPSEDEQVPEFVRKNYPNLKLGPKATKQNFIPFRGSLEDEIDGRQRMRKSPGYQPLTPSGSIDYTALPGEAARRDMNNPANWKTHRDRSGDGELMSRDSWKEKGQDAWVRSPEFDRNQEDRRQGKLPALDSTEGRKQLQALYYDHMKETKREDEAKSGYYTDPYTRLQMPILNEHSTELDKAGAHFRGEFLGRNPAVRLWSGMQDLKEYEQTGNKWKAFNFFRKMAENGMDGLAIRGAMPEGSYGRVGGVASEGLYGGKPMGFYGGTGAVPPRMPTNSLIRQRLLSELIERMTHKGVLGPSKGIVGADAMAARLRASALLKEKLTPANLERLAGQLDYPSPKDGAHFWHGGPVARAEAEKAAKLSGGVTLEMTPNGQMFDRMKLWDGVQSPTTAPEAKAVFRPASRAYATSAEGTVHGYIRKPARSDSIWSLDEEPILRKKNKVLEHPVSDP